VGFSPPRTATQSKPPITPFPVAYSFVTYACTMIETKIDKREIDHFGAADRRSGTTGLGERPFRPVHRTQYIFVMKRTRVRDSFRRIYHAFFLTRRTCVFYTQSILSDVFGNRLFLSILFFAIFEHRCNYTDTRLTRRSNQHFFFFNINITRPLVLYVHLRGKQLIFQWGFFPTG